MSEKQITRDLTPAELTIGEQAMLNFAVAGCKIINGSGQDITLSLLSQASRVNRQYDQLHQKPSAMPAKKANPRPPRVRRRVEAPATTPKDRNKGKVEA